MQAHGKKREALRETEFEAGERENRKVDWRVFVFVGAARVYGLNLGTTASRQDGHGGGRRLKWARAGAAECGCGGDFGGRLEAEFGRWMRKEAAELLASYGLKAPG